MKSAAKLSMAMLTAVLTASEVDPKLLRLIGPDTRAVYGVNVERHRQSMLDSFFPVCLDEVCASSSADDGIRQLITVIYGEFDLRTKLIIFRGARSGPGLGEGMTMLDANTAIVGDDDVVREAIGRWRTGKGVSEEMMASARQLSASYDNWFLVVRPLEKMDRRRAPSALKPEDDLRNLIEEIRGGVRLGAFNEVSVDVVMRSAEDAAALAGIGRWMPGFLQLRGSHGEGDALAALAENVTVRAQGRTVSISFSIEESKLGELVKARRASSPF